MTNEVLRLAEPPASSAVPRVVAPFRNVTVPVGEFPCTVAVRVNCCCSLTLVAEAASVVVVAAGAWSVSEANPVAEEKLVSPL